MDDVLYLCDRKDCTACSPDCRHTRRINHAVNFEKGMDGNSYWEKQDSRVEVDRRKMNVHQLERSLSGQLPLAEIRVKVGDKLYSLSDTVWTGLLNGGYFILIAGDPVGDDPK